jgi:hypothetical protein
MNLKGKIKIKNISVPENQTLKPKISFKKLQGGDFKLSSN